MPTMTVTSKPSPSLISRSGTNFQLLSGGEVVIKFSGLNAGWEEELTLSVGDSLSFNEKFVNFTIHSEYESSVTFYCGFADMRRAKQDLIPVGTTLIKSRMVEVVKGEKILIEPNRLRRKLIIKPLSGEIYIGGLNTNMNDKMPVEYGVPFVLETQAAVYAEISPSFEREKVDVRIIEEINQ
ncbi:TPA: hypothetical protein ACGF6M_001906 [Vibrio cholerae]